jgi:hypothetical protein
MEGAKLMATLLVHLRTQQQYEQEAEAGWVKKWNAVRAPFETEDEFYARRAEHSAHWRWPPWRFNDIVGFVEVIYDGGTRLMTIGHLPRKRISRQLKHKTFYEYGVPGYGKILDAHILPPLREKAVRQALAELLAATDEWFCESGLHLEYDPEWFRCLNLKRLLGLNG